MIEELLKRDDQKRYSLSQHELERRWRAVRERMVAKGIDCLVAQSQNRYAGGHFRWFTDIPAGHYTSTVIFPLKNDMTLITHGGAAVFKTIDSPIRWQLRGVKETISVPAMPNMWWEDAWNAEKAVEVIKRSKPKAVGLVGLGNMSAALYENLNKELPGVNIINASALVDEVRMVKSEEELKLHREAAYLHETSYGVAKKTIRAGRTGTELIAEIKYAQILAGSEEQRISGNYGKVNSMHYSIASDATGTTFSRRAFQDGDVINMLIESSAAGGYWYDLRRFLCIGSVTKELQEAMDIVKEARTIMAANLKPGLLPGVALDASDKFLKSKGCPPEARMGGHGQGLDLAELPAIRRDEPAKLEVGMVLSLHPTARTKYATASVSDTYVITDAGAVPIYENLFNDGEIAVVG